MKRDLSAVRKVSGVFLSFVLTIECFAFFPSFRKEIPTKEIIARHLDSIGPTGARKKLKSLTIGGTSRALFKGRGEGRSNGIVVMASQDEKWMVGMKFDNPEYPYEHIAFDGSNFSVRPVRPGDYTVLGQFLRINERTFKFGILGGVLSTAWGLQAYDEKLARLKASGRSKIDGKELWKYQYQIRKGSDLNVTLYFEPETFRHVRTEYRRVISGGQGLTVDTSSRQNETRYILVETFADFKQEADLTLPRKYTLFLEIVSGTGTISYLWDMEFKQILFDQDLPPSEFKIGSS